MVEMVLERELGGGEEYGEDGRAAWCSYWW